MSAPGPRELAPDSGLPTHALLDADTRPAAMIGTVFAETFVDDAGVVHDRYPATRIVALPDAWYSRPMRWTGSDFADDVDGERGRLVDVAKAAWAAARAVPVAVPGIGTVQTDAGVIQELTIALAGAAAAQAFGLPFPPFRLILLDNTARLLTAPQVVATATTMAGAAQATTDAYDATRTALTAATTLAALWAVVPA